jgi:hypothetical protein
MKGLPSNAPKPFFSSGDDGAPQSAPTLLLISYHFPPDLAVGGLRWQQFAKFIVARGWRVDVIMRDPTALKNRDDARLGQLSSGIRLFAVPDVKARVIRTPQKIWTFVRSKVRRQQVSPRSAMLTASVRREDISRQSLPTRLVRSYFGILDHWEARMWARSAARIAGSVIRTQERRYQAVLTSGPPHMAHEAGRLVASREGLPLVADFRDPWSLVERVAGEKASPLWFALAERAERRVVRQAAVLAMNTEPATEAMWSRYPEARQRITTVWNGSDDEPLPAGERSDRFTIRFAGEIYIDRDPRLVFRAAGAVVKRFRLTPREFGLQFIGDVARFDGVPLEEIAAREGLAGFVETGPFRPRAEAMKFLAGGTMLLSLPQDSDLAVPAKIFEYVRFDAWLLVLARAGSATARLLRGSDADIVDPADLETLTRVIGGRLEQYRRGERPRAVGADGRFDRRIQADVLLGRVDQIAAK